MVMQRMDHLTDLEALVASRPGLYIRYSEGPEKDTSGGSIDTESGLELPGLSVNPLSPEPWWIRPLGDWIARQLCHYKDLRDENPRRYAWVLQGKQVGRGPDCEPLLVDIAPLAWLSANLLTEAEQRYQENFNAGYGPEDGSDDSAGG